MSQKRNVIATTEAPGAVGPYSQAIKTDGLIFVAGEKGIDPKTDKVVPGGIDAETRQTLENIRVILEAAGAGMDNVVRTTVYMTDLGAFQEMNGIYAEYFKNAPPVRTCVQVVALPVGAHIEIEATAVL